MGVEHRWKGPEVQAMVEDGVKSALVRSAAIMVQEIKNQLNKGGPGPASPAGTPPHKQTGILAQSVQADLSKLDLFLVRVGPDIKRAPYARIQEFGGVILPKRVRLLAIPLNDRARKLTRGQRSVRQIEGLTFIARRGKAPILAFIQEDRVTPMFVLVPKVTLPARPYIRPAVKFARPRILKVIRESIQSLGR